MSKRNATTFARTLVVAGIEMAFFGLAAAQTAPAPASASPAAAAASAPAQPDDAVQSVVVSGTRASLAKSLDLKRNSAIVQDSISATELGRFPDDNVADSLSHINGISITRTAGGEGQYVGVRGFGSGYNIVTLNDRILATDGDGRDFAFDVLPSDVISGADVLKSAQASQIEGSIGGTVNLRSARPFDNPGTHAALRLEGDHNDMSLLNGRKVSGVYSTTNNARTLGVVLGAVWAKSNERTDSLNYNTYDASNPGSFDLNGDGTISPNESNLVAPCCIAFGSNFQKKERTAFSGALEWKPTADLHLTLDGLMTHLIAPEVGYNEAYYPDYTPGRWSNVGATNGLITSFTANSFVPEMANISVDREVKTTQVGLNGQWALSPTLKFTGDVYRSKSIRDEGGKDTFLVSGIAGNSTLNWQDNNNGLPNISVTLPDGRDLGTALAAGQLGDADYGLHYVGLSGDNIHDTVTGGTLSGHYDFDLGALESLDFGVSRTNRQKVRDYIDNDWTGGSCQYCDMYGTTFASLGQHVVSPLTVPNFMQGSGGNFPHSLVQFNANAYLNALKSLDGQPVMQDGVPTGATFDFANTLPSRDPTNSYNVVEKTTTAFLEGNLLGEQWSGNVGLRLVHTSTYSETAIDQILAIDDPTPDIATSSPTVTYSDPEPVADRGSYTKALPSANLSYWMDKSLQLRLGAAEVMARPSLDKLAPTRTDTTIDRVYTITIAGNSKLKPTTAKQEDLSLEWYYKPKSALTMALFAKQISNFVTNQTTNNVDIGVPGYLYSIISPINGDRGTVAGLELGFQHLFDNGFGVRMQYTRNKSKAWVQGEYVGQLEGVAPSTSSLGLLYEKDKISASLSFDHTSSYVVNSTTEAGWPNIAEPLMWVTASGSYEINDHLKLFVEGKNLSDALYRSNLGRADASYGYSAWGRTVTAGISLKL
jgi:iron complex outermembrane receptor protein